MRIFVQNRNRPEQILFAFDEVVDPKVTKLRWAVAYSTRKGCVRLVERVLAKMGSKQWDSCEKTFLTSLDFGITEPAALEYLSSLPNSNVLVANANLAKGPRLFPVDAYHPKVYLFDTKERVGFVVGSANLTNSALLHNTEAVTVGVEPLGESSWSAAWTYLEDGTEPLTQMLLTQYKKIWRPKNWRIIVPDQAPPEPDIQPRELAVLWEAIQRDRVDISKFNHFWVQAGSMSSGGSHNQLELPRGANRFFNFKFSKYDLAHSVIGQPKLQVSGRLWNDRKLTWHGNNKMERINLPTRVQGGFDYPNTAILFRRRNSGYEIEVRAWSDDSAKAWRVASEELKTIFRLGEKGKRVCGFF